jgi:DNA polymerase-3 subunit delta
MIIKNFELKKKNLKDNKYFLLYGNNEGLIEETIEEILKPILAKNIYNYEETEILKNVENFKENLLNKSFFEDEKLIIIKRVSDKFFKIIEEIISKDLDDLSFILVANNLDKRSKIRVFF